MNKKVMAVAVAGALAVPAVAFAQASNVQISGRAQLTFANVKASGATISGNDLKSRNRVDDNSSRIRFRGSENLGGGLRAIFLMEAGVNVDTGDASRGSTAYPASREGYVGLAGSWGQLTLGKQNVWWTNFADQTQANYINHGLQYATGGNSAGVSWALTRIPNDIKYTSPNWNGFRFFANYAPNTASESAGPGADADGTHVGVTAAYLSRMWIAQFDWAQNEVAGPSPYTRTGTKFGVGWKYQPSAILSLILIKLENENVGGVSGRDREVSAWQLNWSHMMGKWQWIAQVGANGDRKGSLGAGNTGSKGFTVAAKYHFSKRTGAYVSFTKVTNESAGGYDYRGGGNAVGMTGATAGADPQIFGIGIQHNF